jgi:hypothetical protein
MSNSKKLLIAALAVILAVGATPLFAELEGTWAGDGRGFIVDPSGIPSDTVYVWQHWEGTVRDGDFWGEWSDADGHHGKFKGGIILMSITEAYCEGEWLWIDDSVEPPVIRLRGSFDMIFRYRDDDETCSGNWYYNNVQHGNMRGRRIE